MANEFEAAFKKYQKSPYLFVKELVRPPMITHQQELVLKSLEKSRHIAVKSGHGVGKSALSAWITLWFMLTHPMCKVAITAPTQHQLEDVLWSELKKWTNSCDLLYDLFDIRKTKMVVKDPRYEEIWFAVPISVRKPESLQGFHADSLLFIMDEASGIPDNVFEPIEGALTSSGCYSVMFGNPTKVSGTFYDAFNKHAKQYKTFTFSSEESPLVSKEYVQRMRDKFGYDSDVYRVRVLGEFPSGSLNSVISIESIESAFNNEKYEEIPGEVSFGVDVARYGDDETVVAIVNGNVVVDIARYRNLDSVEIAEELERLYYIYTPSKIKIELSGVGAGVFDLIKRKNIKCKKIAFIPQAEPYSKEFADSMTEAWFNLRELFKINILGKSGIVMKEDLDALEQLASRSYTILPNGKFKLEDKASHKKKNNGISPDIGDALSIAFYEGKTGKLRDTLKANNFVLRGDNKWQDFPRIKW